MTVARIVTPPFQLDSRRNIYVDADEIVGVEMIPERALDRQVNERIRD
jgi:hypothetical protein